MDLLLPRTPKSLFSSRQCPPLNIVWSFIQTHSQVTILGYFASTALSCCRYRIARTYLHFPSVFLSVLLRFPTVILQRFNQRLMFEFLSAFRRYNILTFRVQRERKKKNSIVNFSPFVSHSSSHEPSNTSGVPV